MSPALSKVGDTGGVPGLQAKLTVSRADDPLERQADELADRAMRMPLPGARALAGAPVAVQRKCGACTDAEEEVVQRKCSACADAEGVVVQRKCGACGSAEELADGMAMRAGIGGAPSVTPDVGSRIAGMRGQGSPLPSSTRAFFEPRMGARTSRTYACTRAREPPSSPPISGPGPSPWATKCSSAGVSSSRGAAAAIG